MTVMRIATYNIHRCIGRDGKENYQRIADVLLEMNADVVALQEVTSGGEKGDMLAHLAGATGAEPIEGFTLIAAGAHYGNGLLIKPSVAAINRIDISVLGREPRGVIEAAFHLNHLHIRLLATHLGLGIRERHRQIRQLEEAVSASKADIDILLGDFNEWLSWSRPLSALNRRFNASRSLHPAPATFPAWKPLLKLDRLWVRPVDRLAALRTHATTLSRIASDHLPVVAEIIIDR